MRRRCRVSSLPSPPFVGGLWFGACVLLGCQVDSSVLDTGRFPCSTSTDCGPGWGCLRAGPLADDFCAPLCGGGACDGVCTGGEQPWCLEGCRVGVDGAGCRGDAFECLRISAETGDGVCFPKRVCETTLDCAAGEVCLGELLAASLPGSALRFDNLYCMPVGGPDAICPAGLADVALPDSPAPLCRVRCSSTDPSCPLGFGCLGALERVAPVLPEFTGAVCDVGTFGLGCRDDTNCIVGRCLDSGTAQGKVCTVTCDEASVRTGGCGGLIDEDSVLGRFATMECDPEAMSSDRSGLCVPRYTLSFPGCTPEAGGAYPCAAGLRCRSFDFASGEPIQVCTRPCDDDEDCERPRRRAAERVTCQVGLCLWGEE